MSTDIVLPKDWKPLFPRLCIRCCGEQPEETAKFAASRFSALQVAFAWIWLFRKSLRHHVPVCSVCRFSVRWRKSLDLLAYAAMVAASIAIVFPWLQSMGIDRQWQKLGGLVGALVLMAPYFLWTVIFPPAFDMTVRKDCVEFEFGNRQYAELFAAANLVDGAGDVFTGGDEESVAGVGDAQFGRDDQGDDQNDDEPVSP